MGSVVSKDVPPYVTVGGHPAAPHGLNTEGLRRRGFDNQALQNIKRAYKLLYKEHLKLSEAAVSLREMAQECPEISLMSDFLESSERSIVR
jgi:UDP-N-acetylglucosamine acyltransferase